MQPDPRPSRPAVSWRCLNPHGTEAIIPPQTVQPAARIHPAVFVEVRDPTGNAWCVPLAMDRVLIGRAAEADVRLERTSVSRRHAELVRDTFGRWWVRDLDSRAGVFVNGVRVQEMNLQPGDEIAVARFTLTFNGRGRRPGERVGARVEGARPEGARREGDRSTTIVFDDTTETRIQSLAEVEPPKIDTLHLTTLSEFGQRLTQVSDQGERLRLLCRFMVRKDFHGYSAMALRLDKRTPEDPLRVLCVQSERGWQDQSNYVSRRVIKTLQRTRTAVIASNAHPEAAMDLSSLGDMHIASIACMLHEDDDQFDLLYVILPEEFGTAEWLALVELAVKQYQQAASVWQARQEAKLHAAIEQDLDNARKIQLSLVPRTVSIPGLDVAVDYQPSRFVGGDYVDVVPMRDGRTLLVSADVSGKGLPAALVALSLHSMVHTSLRSGMALVDMMNILNEHLLEYLEPESFVTMACVAMSPAGEDGCGALEVVNAGHLPPFVVGPDGSTRELQSGAHMPLGLDDSDGFVAEHERLQPGEMLGLFTDGLTEIALPDGRLVGLEGLGAKLSKLYKSHRNRGIEEVADRLNEWLNDLEADHARRDDRSFLLVRLRG